LATPFAHSCRHCTAADENSIWWNLILTESAGFLCFLQAGFMIPSASCGSWRCFLAKKFVRILGPPLFEWLSRISLKLIKFLDPRWSLA
jgi:hypothetical protein